MTVLRTTLAITGLVWSSISLQAGYITDASAAGGTLNSSLARAQNGVLFGGAGSNFACAGGASSTGGTTVTNSFANITCESGRAFASADLVTGSLRGFALSSGSPGTTANTTALLADEVTFNNSTGGGLLLGVSYLTHGTVTGETLGVSTKTSCEQSPFIPARWLPANCAPGRHTPWPSVRLHERLHKHPGPKCGGAAHLGRMDRFTCRRDRRSVQ